VQGRDPNEDLVPLAAAVAVVFFHLTGARLPENATQGRDEAIRLTATALAQVASIVVRDGRGEHAAQLGDFHEPLQLDRFFVRRRDLRAATDTLGRIWREVAPASHST